MTVALAVALLGSIVVMKRAHELTPSAGALHAPPRIEALHVSTSIGEPSAATASGATRISSANNNPGSARGSGGSSGGRGSSGGGGGSHGGGDTTHPPPKPPNDSSNVCVRIPDVGVAHPLGDDACVSLGNG
jgi:hypothetical protein